MGTTAEREPEWISQAPITIQRQTEIRATPAAVWNELATNETWVHWFPGFKASSFTTDAPHGVGSVRSVHQDNFKVVERITRWVPNELWAMTVTKINVPVIAAMAEDVVLEAVDGGTAVTWRIGVELAGLGRVLRGPLVKKSSAGLDTALAQLAERIGQQTVEQQN